MSGTRPSPCDTNRRTELVSARYTTARVRWHPFFRARRGRSTTIQILKIAWANWLAFIHALGNFQARVLLTVLYVLFVGPIGLTLRWRTDPLKLRPHQQASYWLKRETRDLTLEDARRQS
jgi:hypothetical protein